MQSGLVNSYGHIAQSIMAVLPSTLRMHIKYILGIRFKIVLNSIKPLKIKTITLNLNLD